MDVRLASEKDLERARIWRQAQPLETMTCRPVTPQGGRVAPSERCVTCVASLEHGGEPLGRFTLFDFNPRNRSAEFGYLIDPDQRGKGFGHQMIAACLDGWFRAGTLNKLYCQTAAFNEASWRALERLGLSRDGILRRHHELDGHLWDDYLYSLLRDEWTVAPWARPDQPPPPSFIAAWKLLTAK